MTLNKTRNFHIKVRKNLKGEKIYHYVIKIKNIKFKFKFNPRAKNNNIYIIKPSGKKIKISLFQLRLKNIKVLFQGRNNTLIFHEPIKIKKGRFNFYGSRNMVDFGSNNYGIWNISCYENKSKAIISANNQCSEITITLVNSAINIGSNNMFASGIKIWSDGHAVIDYNTKQVLNLPKKPIKIGSHIWLGERVTLTKNAEIPDDTIVGIASVVTKAFYEKHTVIAGNPACVVKNGVSWHGASPINYYKNIQPKIYSPPERLEKGSLASGGR